MRNFLWFCSFAISILSLQISALSQELIAHRGYSSNYPENTIESIKASIDYGIEWIELDIRSTKDGILVILHDDSLNRTSNRIGRLDQLTLKELDSVNFNYPKKFGDKFPFIKIPTLEEVFDLVGNDYRLLLDIKENWNLEEIGKLADRKGIAHENLSFIIYSFSQYELLRKSFKKSKMYLILYQNSIISDFHMAFVKSAGINGLAINNYFPIGKFKQTINNLDLEVLIWNAPNHKNLNSEVIGLKTYDLLIDDPTLFDLEELPNNTTFAERIISKKKVTKLHFISGRIFLYNPNHEKIIEESLFQIDGKKFELSTNHNGIWELPGNLSSGVYVFRVYTNVDAYSIKISL